MRENETILIVDRCHNESTVSKDLRTLTYHAKNLSEDAGITVDDSGITFKASNITTLCK